LAQKVTNHIDETSQYREIEKQERVDIKKFIEK
jgi:hypothetical protein